MTKKSSKRFTSLDQQMFDISAPTMTEMIHYQNNWELIFFQPLIILISLKHKVSLYEKCLEQQKQLGQMTQMLCHTS